MEKIKRYDVSNLYDYTEVVIEEDDGEWCKWEDVEKLRASIISEVLDVLKKCKEHEDGYEDTDKNFVIDGCIDSIKTCFEVTNG